jgi:hypothetical protein
VSPCFFNGNIDRGKQGRGSNKFEHSLSTIEGNVRVIGDYENKKSGAFDLAPLLSW